MDTLALNHEKLGRNLLENINKNIIVDRGDISVYPLTPFGLTSIPNQAEILKGLLHLVIHFFYSSFETNSFTFP